MATLAITVWIFNISKETIPKRLTHRLIPTLLIFTLPLFLICQAIRINSTTYTPSSLEEYHPGKLAESPFWQLLAFGKQTASISHFTNPVNSWGILNACSPTTQNSSDEEIAYRLGGSIDSFTSHQSSPPSWLKKRPSHVFFFLMESFEYHLIENPILQPVTPELYRLSREGISLSQFSASGNSTIDAVHSIASGTATFPPYPDPKNLRDFPLDTLPRIMKKAHYSPLFFAASRRKFSQKGDVTEAYGYDRFLGCPDLAPEIPSNDWGVNDGDFFNWSYNQLANLKSPHFITFLNVSYHPPYTAPLETLKDIHFSKNTIKWFRGKNDHDKERYAKHAYYADQQIGVMVRKLHNRYPDALFIFTGDHNSSKMKSDTYKRVPFILWNPNILDTNIDTSSWFGSHMDILATVAPLVLPENTPFKTLGNPVWNTDTSRVSLGINHLLSSATPIPHTRYLDTRLLPEQRVQLENPTPSQQKLLLKASAIEALSWEYLNHPTPKVKGGVD